MLLIILARDMPKLKTIRVSIKNNKDYFLKVEFLKVSCETLGSGSFNKTPF